MENVVFTDLPNILELDEDMEDDGVSVQEITTRLNSLFGDYSSARSSRETVWRVCMILYYASVNAYKQLEAECPELLGQIKTDWRHKTHGPFAYENVETVVGYFQDATFPNDQWFTLEPTKKEDTFRALVATALMHHKLEEAEVKKHFEDLYRMQSIIGFGAMALPWERREGKLRYRTAKETKRLSALGYPLKETVYEPAERDYCLYDNLKLEVLDPTHIYLDPTANDANEGNIFRVIPMQLKDILGKMQSGSFREYPVKEVTKAAKQLYAQRGNLTDSLFLDIQGYGTFNKDVADQLCYDVVEFYGDFIIDDELFVDYHAVFLGDLLFVFEPNQYWAGKPFIISNYTRVQGRPYGMGLLEPSMGYYVLVDVIQNQRLDTFELALNGGIIKLKQSSGLDAEEVTIEPGKVLDVIEADDITLLELPLDNVRIAREEIAAIVDQIQKAGGNSSYVNAGVARQGERVTGTEVEAVKESGGNRLRLVNASNEYTSTKLFLKKAFRMYTQHVDKKTAVRVLGKSKLGRMLHASTMSDTELIQLEGKDPTPPEYLFVNAGPAELEGFFDINPRGSSYMLNKQEGFNAAVNLVTLFLSNPATAAHTDVYEAMRVVAEHSTVDGWERIIKKNAGTDDLIEQQKKIQEAQQPAPPADPMAAGAEVMQDPIVGGADSPGARIGEGAALSAAAAAGGLEPALQELSGAQVPGQIPSA